MEMLKTIQSNIIIDTDFYELLRPLYNPNFSLTTINLVRERDNIYEPPEWNDFHSSFTAISQQVNTQLTSSAQHEQFVNDYLEERKARVEDAGTRIKKVLGNN